MPLHTSQSSSFLSPAGRSICSYTPDSQPHPCHQQAAAYAPKFQTVHLILVTSRQEHMLLHTRQSTSSLSSAGRSICSYIPDSPPHRCHQQARAYASTYQTVHLIVVTIRQEHMLLHTRQSISSLSPAGKSICSYIPDSPPQPCHQQAGAYVPTYQTVHLIVVTSRQEHMLLHTRQSISSLSPAGRSICSYIPDSPPHPCHQQAGAYAPTYQTVHLILVTSRQNRPCIIQVVNTI